MILYLDTSSLVKAFVDVVATSRIACPELRAALARRRRDGTLQPRVFAAAKRAFEHDWPQCVIVDATAALCQAAGELAERYGLSGYDSVHLASFASIVEGAGADVVRFSSFDDRLNDAASGLMRARRRSS